MPRQSRPVEEAKEERKFENEYQRIFREDYKLKVNPIGDYSISWKEIDGKGVACDRFQPGSDAEVMMWNLALQDKIKTRIPREAKEPVESVATVILNGLRVNILKGVTVELPEQIADQIEQSYYATEKALEGNHQRLSGGWGATRTDLMSEKERTNLE